MSAGRRKAKVVRAQWAEPQAAAGMLRAPEPRPGEAEAAACSPRAAPPTQSKPLTSFLIQDILRDGPERRRGQTGHPQPPPRSDPRRDPELEPEGGRGEGGRARAPEEQLSTGPCAAPGEAETLAESEPGKTARPGRPGRAGRAPGLQERTDWSQEDLQELGVLGCCITVVTDP